MADVLRFWLRRGVNGFRIDAAAVLAQDVQLRDDPLDSSADEQRPAPEQLKRVYANYQPVVLDWLAELRCVVDEFPDRVLLGEVEATGEKSAHFYGDQERPIVRLPLNYRLLDTPGKHRRSPRWLKTIWTCFHSTRGLTGRSEATTRTVWRASRGRSPGARRAR